jgi:prepilin-type N-terminal cleavage/methylation domain-containing protein/prepilin-type processing-associated H-X9-DG protein
MNRNPMSSEKKRAFSLIELLVVISLIALMIAILLPALSLARSQSRSLVCNSNLRQLFLANTGYAIESDNYYVPAAPDINTTQGGRYRWHGVRNSPDEPFDPTKGPLAAYLADGKVKQCPERVDFAKSGKWNDNFEKGCGGYGYNRIYLGSRQWQERPSTTALQTDRAGWETTKTTEVSRPIETLMFADTAMSNNQSSLIEYSFAEPPFCVYKGNPVTSFYLSPSIHFRHRSKANVIWADGHTDSQLKAQFDENNVYGVSSTAMNLGWFKPIDNSLFDLE